MSKSFFSNRPDFSSFEKHIGELRSQLSGADPYLLEDRTGARFLRLGEARGEFQLNLWRQAVTLSFPDYHAFQAPTREPLPAFNSALLIYYFVTADGTPLSGKWISFSELPDGRFYTQAFQGYSGKELSRSFQNDQESFTRAAETLGGLHQPLGDASFAFQALPRVPLLVAHWQGDEDFPSSFQILFDAEACHYLPTDAYAIIGSTITRRLISVSAER